MANYCPLVKDNCRQQDCILWKADRCLLVTFLDTGVALRTSFSESSGDEDAFPDEISNRSNSELASELAAFVKELPSYGMKCVVAEVSSGFWSDKGVVNRYSVPEKLELKIGEVEKLVQKQIDKERESILRDLTSVSAEGLAKDVLSYASKELSSEDILQIYPQRLFNLYWQSLRLNAYSFPADLQLKVEKAVEIVNAEFDKREEAGRSIQFAEEKRHIDAHVNDCLQWSKSKHLSKVNKSDIDAFLLDRNIKVLKETRDLLYSLVNAALRQR